MNENQRKKLTRKPSLTEKKINKQTSVDIVASDEVIQKKVVDLLSLINIKTNIHVNGSSF